MTWNTVILKAELKKVESEGPDNISALEKLVEALTTKSKHMSRNIESMKEKLNAFVGQVGHVWFMCAVLALNEVCTCSDQPLLAEAKSRRG
jgi:hypothetical protein